MPELAEGQKTLDNVLCDSRNFFDCPVLIAQTNNIVTFIKEESCLLIALLIAWYSSLMFCRWPEPNFRSARIESRNLWCIPAQPSADRDLKSRNLYSSLINKYGLCWWSDVVCAVIHESSRTALEGALRIISEHTIDCIYPWTHPCKTCFHMTSNVWVSGVKLSSFPAQMWSVVLNDFWNCTLIFAQLLRKNNPAQVLSLDSANRWKWDAFLIISSFLVD